METLKNCPVCDSNSFSAFLEVEDFFLTHENFSLVKCNSCNFVFTNPRPSENDLGKYYQSVEYISHSSSTISFKDKVYYSVRNYTIKKKFKLIWKYFKNGNILDIGCGTGEFLNFFKLKGWNTTGIEPNNSARKTAIEKYGLNIHDEKQLDKFKDSSFDVITMWHVLEHVPDLRMRIQQIKSLIKENGVLIIAVPNIDSKDAKTYGKFWAALDVPRHLYHFNQSSIRKLFENSGFELKEILPMKFDAFYISMISEKYKTGKANYIKAIYNGLKSNLYATSHKDNYSSNIYVLKLKNR
jgi:2-polyprenyl-3-methyl-5-hydroxy-6-metoxy-1,4-benzoquinol methylase